MHKIVYTQVLSLKPVLPRKNFQINVEKFSNFIKTSNSTVVAWTKESRILRDYDCDTENQTSDSSITSPKPDPKRKKCRVVFPCEL